MTVHQACMAMQRELAARGSPGVVALRIRDAATRPAVEVTISPPGPIEPATWMGRTLPIPLDGNGSITGITSSSLLAWNYQPQTGFIDNGSPAEAITLTFEAGASASAIQHQLTVFPLGYAEVP